MIAWIADHRVSSFLIFVAMCIAAAGIFMQTQADAQAKFMASCAADGRALYECTALWNNEPIPMPPSNVTVL